MGRATGSISCAGETIIILLCGGDKSTQQKDIKTAKRLADEWREDYA